MVNSPNTKKNNAILFEIVGGLFFIYGIGWLFAGNKVRGWVLIIGSLIGLTSILSFISATWGLGYFCCAPLVYLGLLFDVLSLRQWLKNPIPDNFKGMFKKGMIFYFIGLAIIIVCVILLIIFGLPKLPFELFNK